MSDEQTIKRGSGTRRASVVHSFPRAGLGVLAAAVVASVGHLLSFLIAPGASPVLAVADAAVAQSPAPMREFAISTFGTADKPVLFAGIAVTLLLLSAAAGVAERSAAPRGSVVLGVLALIGVAAAASRPTANWAWVIPSLAGGVAGIVVLRCGVRLYEERLAASGSEGETLAVSRRKFLAFVGGVAGLTLAVGGLGIGLARKAGDLAAERLGITLPSVAAGRRARRPGPELEAPVSDGTPFLTPNEEFYRIDTALQVPALSIEDWSLRIHGMVDREIELNWEDLNSRMAMERIITLTCVSNEVGGGLAGTATWTGFPIRDLLDEVGVRPDADMLLSTSVDGWTSGTPLAALTDGRDAILAVGMNGEALPVEHGYPVRQVVPGLYGYVSATKWVVDWEITRFDRASSYWTDRGWGEKGPIKTASRIDRPGPLAELSAGRNVIAGTAWAQHRGITKVEVKVDQGPWEEAKTAAAYSVDTWRMWSWEWEANPGIHTVVVRATDGNGEVQTEQRVGTVPDGATGWHSRTFRVVAAQ